MHLSTNQDGDGDLKKNRQNGFRKLDENVRDNPSKDCQYNPESKEKEDEEE